MNNNEINFRTPRTIVGTAMELAVAIQVIVMWGVTFWLFRGATSDLILSLICHGIVCTAIPLLMMVLCYFPKTFNMPVRRPRVEHYMLTVQLIRVCCIIIMPILIAATWKLGRPADQEAMDGVQAIFGCMVTLAVGYYMFRFIRMR